LHHGDVAERVKKIVVEHLGVDADKQRRSELHRRFGADSLDTVELVMALEESSHRDLTTPPKRSRRSATR
jgi:acyl carrier protein